MPILNERLHLTAEKSKPGVSMHGLLLAMQLPGADCPGDFFQVNPNSSCAVLSLRVGKVTP